MESGYGSELVECGPVGFLADDYDRLMNCCFGIKVENRSQQNKALEKY